MDPSPPAQQQPDSHGRAVPWFVMLAALLLYVVRLGYDYGLSDQDEILPFLFHRLDPTVLAQDWFVQGQAAVFSVRTYFVSLLRIPALMVPVWLVVAGFYAAFWLLIAGAVYALAHAFTASRIAAAAAVVAALVLTPQWTLGGNDLAHRMLVPSMAGWAAGLWALVFFLRGRLSATALLLGIATWMQALVGLQLAGLLGLILLWRVLRGEEPIRPLLLFGGIYALAALPALGPLVYQQLGSTSPVTAEGAPSMFYILAEFRAPHHFLFYAFPARSLLRFGVLLGLGVVAAALLVRRQALRQRGLWMRLLICIAGFGLLAFVCTEVVVIPFVAQLQFFKMTVLAKLLMVIVICGAAAAWLPAPMTRLLDRLFDRPGWSLGVVLVLWALLLGGLALGVDGLRLRIGPLAHAETPVAEVETWARTQTPRDAVFAVPPSWSGFRSRAQRAIVVNFKAFPFRDSLNGVWFERLTAMAPIGLPERSGPALQDSLNAAFMRQPAAALRRLAARYGFDYVVRNRPLAAADSAFEPVFTAAPWVVYHIVSDNPPAE